MIRFRGRRAVSTMIGGIIVLTLLLTALGTMVYVSQQYDAYQSTVNRMSQKDIDRFSENLVVVYPGLNPPVSGCGSTCTQFSMSMNNLGGIGTQIARIYINSPGSGSCTNLCLLDPSTTALPNYFRSSDSFINQGENQHTVVFWLPNGATLPTATVSIVTTRGRIFTFQYPFPPAGSAVASGTLDLGPIRIDLREANLITYTTGTKIHPGVTGCANAYPSSTPCMPVAWLIPWQTDIVFYVRISNIGGSPVKLLDKSTFYAVRYTGAGGGSNPALYIARPMTQSCHDTYFSYSYFDSTWPSSGDCPVPSTLAAYNSTGSTSCNSGNPCYVLPPGPTQGQPGTDTFVLFSASALRGSTSNQIGPTGFNQYVVFLALYYVWNGYEFGITLPFISFATCDPSTCPT